MATNPTMIRLPKTYPISSIKQETDHVKTFAFPVSFNAKPGQFLMVWLPGIDEVPMSIAMDDGTETRITFFDIGDMTKALFRCKEGDFIGLRGPFGTHYEWQPGQHLILVAGGYGAAPMYFVAKEAVNDGCSIDFIVGARSKGHLLYLDEIGALKNTTLHIATDDGSMGHKGYNTEVLETLLHQQAKEALKNAAAVAAIRKSLRFATVFEPSLRVVQSFPNTYALTPNTSVFACGPELMLKRISEICAERNISCAMSLERYMKCGYGLCGNCVVDPLGIRLCTDGPVVSNETCLRITEFGKYHRDDVGRKQFLK